MINRWNVVACTSTAGGAIIDRFSATNLDKPSCDAFHKGCAAIITEHTVALGLTPLVSRGLVDTEWRAVGTKDAIYGQIIITKYRG
ncbi:hypothetical protein [Yersinia phage vB_YenM_P778]